VVEQRQHARVPIDIAVTFFVKGRGREHTGTAKNISVGGMLVETASLPTFGATVEVYIVLPGADGRVRLPGVVRWVQGGAMGIQFSMLGARETYLITQLAKSA
jgi:type IV pilus assembly protein PilZ